MKPTIPFYLYEMGEVVRAKRERQSHFDLNMLEVGATKRERQSLNAKTPKSYEIGVFYAPVARFSSLL